MEQMQKAKEQMKKAKEQMKQKMKQTRKLVGQVMASLKGGQTPDDEEWEEVELEDAAGMKETTAQPGVSAEAQRLLKAEAQRLLKESRRLRGEAWERTMTGQISEVEKEAYFATKAVPGIGPRRAASLLEIMTGTKQPE